VSRYVSTAGRAPSADLAEAVARGLAPDGGLYVPERLERLADADMDSLAGASLQEVAQAIALRQFAGSVEAADTRRIVAGALDFDIPLRRLDADTYVLELFHGPTLAFKDVGARTLARLLRHLRGEAPLTVLVATSGDTGSAVAHAFHGVPGARVVVLYPRGQVSRLQEAQFATLGGNVTAVAVDGSFDDCQRLVKDAFLDPAMAPLGLTSANSINIGRLLPQAWYYWYAALQLRAAPRPLVFATPSGNLGNLAAGLIARRMGAPIDGFVAATNANDVVPEYRRTGRYTPRPSRRTLSNAMDVGAPSNLERIRALYGGDVHALAAEVFGSAHDDDATRGAIAAVAARHGYVMDPHTAVGYLGLQHRRAAVGPATGVVLGTAHPAKFPEVVEPILGRALAPPAALAACLARPVHATPLPPRAEALRALLLSLGRA
jgi:threonine synthase